MKFTYPLSEKIILTIKYSTREIMIIFQGPVQLGENAIIMTAEESQRLSPSDLNRLSRTLYVFCRRAAKDGRAFKLVQSE